MDTKNPSFESEYPDWKKNLWGALRAFVAGFLASLATCLITADTEKIADLDWWLKFALVGSLVGGIIALGKFLRDMFPESALFAKLPI